MGDESYGSFYNGGLSSFEPGYNLGGSFIGYRMSAATLSSNTNPTVANQIKETVARIKEGAHNVEIGTLDNQMLDSIPKQHFAELKALMKLSGVAPSMHAPIIDPAGFEKNAYSDENRAEAERKIYSAVEKANMLDSAGNVPVVIHATGGVQGDEYRPGKKDEGESEWHRKSMSVFSKEKKQVVGIIPEEKEYKIGMTEKEYAEGGQKINAPEKVNDYNERQWLQEKQNVNYYVDLMNQAKAGVVANFGSKKPEGDEETKDFSGLINRTERYIETNQDHIDQMWNLVGKYGSREQKEELKKISNKFKDRLNTIAEQQRKTLDSDQQTALVEMRADFVEDVYDELNKITSGYDPHKSGKIQTKESEKIWGAPKVLIGAEEFAKEKTAETIGNVAWRGYKNLGGDKAPVLAIENMYQGMAFSRAEDMKGIIDESRKVFVKNAIKEGMDKKDAKKSAEKLIGVTWDVGHLNIFKKEGFTDKNLIEETKKIAPYVKHVHLTDNFGYGDSHLAPGMGNVPFKEILKELEKTGRLSEMKKVIEAGGLIANQLTSSQFKPTLEAFGVQMQQGGGYWNQATSLAMGGGYFGGQGYLPEKHFSMYGSGFSSLPTELGGQIPGTTSRATGAPMA